MRSWPLFLQLQAGTLPQRQARFVDGDPEALLIGPSPEEEYRFRQMVGGPFKTLELPNDMHDMHFDNGVFHTVYASNVLEHAFAPYCALMEIRRVLRLNGIAHFAMPRFDGPGGGDAPLHLHCLTADVWGVLLQRTGFLTTEQEEQVGYFEPRAGYHVFHCRAVQPPPPHDNMLQNLMWWVEAGRPTL